MTDLPATQPWALSRATEITDTVQFGYASIDIDPITQTARYHDADGALVEPIEANKHGSATNTYKPTGTGGDGSSGGSKSDQDTHFDGDRD